MRIFHAMTLMAAVTLTTPTVAQDSAPQAAMATAIDPQAASTVDTFHQALQAGDLSAASAVLANDALIFEIGGVERGKAEYASHHLPADAAFAKAVTRAVTRRSGHASGDLAWIGTEATAKGSYKGRAINSVSTETMVLRRQNNAWRIVHIHWSSANAK